MHARAHCLRSGTVNPFTAFERVLSTNKGLTNRISIPLVHFSRVSADEKKSLKALVAEYTVTYGAGNQPRKEDKLMIALLVETLTGLIWGNKMEVIPAIEVQLTLIMLMIKESENSSKLLMSEVPTLFTSSPILNPSNSRLISSKNAASLQLVKLATKLLNFWTLPCLNLTCEVRSLRLWITLLIFYQLRDTMQMLHPKSARYSQKPKPMPSVPPVTTTHEPSWSKPYFVTKSCVGSSYLKVQKMIRQIGLRNCQKPRAAATQTMIQRIPIAIWSHLLINSNITHICAKNFKGLSYR